MVGRARAPEGAPVPFPGFPASYVSPPSAWKLIVVINLTEKVNPMNIAISTESPKVFSSNGRIVTTSQAVSDYFDKQHKDVLRKIDTLECSPEFTCGNFSLHVEKQVVGVAEREIRYYEITKDGFMFLVMGFTGKKAARLKEAYIAKFNHMEAELHKPVALAPCRNSYSIIIDMENDLPVCSRVLMPGEHVMTFESFMEQAIRCGYVLLPCDEIGKITYDEMQGLVDKARKIRAHWDEQCSSIEKKYFC